MVSSFRFSFPFPSHRPINRSYLLLSIPYLHDTIMYAHILVKTVSRTKPEIAVVCFRRYSSGICATKREVCHSKTALTATTHRGGLRCSGTGVGKRRTGGFRRSCVRQ